jgi:hypothetical protein
VADSPVRKAARPLTTLGGEEPHIFGPAAMTRTDFYSRPQVLTATDIARPYATQPSGTRFDFSTSEFSHSPTGQPAATRASA